MLSCKNKISKFENWRCNDDGLYLIDEFDYDRFKNVSLSDEMFEKLASKYLSNKKHLVILCRRINNNLDKLDEFDSIDEALLYLEEYSGEYKYSMSHFLYSSFSSEIYSRHAYMHILTSDYDYEHIHAFIQTPDTLDTINFRNLPINISNMKKLLSKSDRVSFTKTSPDYYQFNRLINFLDVSDVTDDDEIIKEGLKTIVEGCRFFFSLSENVKPIHLKQSVLDTVLNEVVNFKEAYHKLFIVACIENEIEDRKILNNIYESICEESILYGNSVFRLFLERYDLDLNKLKLIPAIDNKLEKYLYQRDNLAEPTKIKLLSKMKNYDTELALQYIILIFDNKSKSDILNEFNDLDLLIIARYLDSKLIANPNSLTVINNELNHLFGVSYNKNPDGYKVLFNYMIKCIEMNSYDSLSTIPIPFKNDNHIVCEVFIEIFINYLMDMYHNENTEVLDIDRFTEFLLNRTI